MSHPTVVVGGGVAGLGVAVELGRRGRPVLVLEGGDAPGGRAAEWACMATEQCQRCGVCLLHDTVAAARKAPNIEIRTGSPVTAARRTGDGFALQIGREATTEVSTRSLVLATGFDPFDPAGARPIGNEGLDAAVTTVDLNRALRRDDPESLGFTGGTARRIAFLQCVGSRDPEAGHPYCSQICCTVGLNHARRLLHLRPEWEATLFYIDLQIHGKGARTRFGALPPNLRLVQGVPAELRTPRADDAALSLAYQGPDGRMAVEDFDGAVMAVGMVPRPGTSALAEGLGMTSTVGGFLPSRATAGGLYTAGTCRGPANIESSLLQARQVAARLLYEQGQRERHAWVLAPPDRRLSSAPRAESAAPITAHPVCRTVAVVGTGPETSALAGALRTHALRVTVVPLPDTGPAPALLEGSLGDFRLTLRTPQGREVIHAGAVILASAGLRTAPADGADLPGVAALTDASPDTPPPNAVALWLDAEGPTWRPLARDALERAAGAAEAGVDVSLVADHVSLPGLDAQGIYDRARQAGVRLFRPGDVRPRIQPRGADGLELELRDATVPEIPARLVVDRLLVAETVAPPTRAADALGIRTDAEGFAQAPGVRLAPLRTERAGVFALGSARREVLPAELADEVEALAAELHSLLAEDTLQWPEAAVSIDTSRCIRCLSCVRTCPHGALEMPLHELSPRPLALACEACGQCRAVCPASAIRDRDEPARSPRSHVAHVRSGPYTPGNDVQPVTVFACRNSGAPAWREAQANGNLPASGVAMVEVPCGGAIDELTVLGTLLGGGKRVIVATCHPDACAHHDGDRQCALRIQRIHQTLRQFGLPAETVVQLPLSPAEPTRLATRLHDLTREGGAR